MQIGLAGSVVWRNRDRVVAAAIGAIMLAACSVASAQTEDYGHPPPVSHAAAEAALARPPAHAPPEAVTHTPVQAQPTRMPDYVGGTESAARNDLTRRFHLNPSVKLGPSNLARGLVFEQLPPRDTNMREVRQVVLSVSSGVRPESHPTDGPPPGTRPGGRKPPPPDESAPMRMPNYVGEPIAAAYNDVLKRFGRRPHVQKGDSKTPPGEVYAQNPRPQTYVRDGDDIELFVSPGSMPNKSGMGPIDQPPAPPETLMPDYTKQSFVFARADLQKRLHRTALIERSPSNLDADLVFTQEPQPGTDLAHVSRVVLSVSTGQPPMLMPDYTGIESVRASNDIRSRFHRAAQSITRPSNLAAGLVFDQSPRHGADLSAGENVVLYVSSGPQTEPMPNFIGEPFDSASQRVTAQLRRKAIRLDGQSTLDEGRVFNQDPRPGSDVRNVGQIKLYVSNGTLDVPDIVGKSEAQAIEELSTDKLVPKKIGVGPSRDAPGTILSTDPVAGTSVARGATVGYRVASGEHNVPDVRGHPLQDADRILEAAGFKRGGVSRSYSGKPGLIVEQNPAPETVAILATPVDVTVAADPPVVPAVSGATPEAAQAQLKNAGLNTSTIVHEYSFNAAGTVLRQDPPAGSRAVDGGRVTLWVAQSPLAPVSVGAGTFVLLAAGSLWLVRLVWPKVRSSVYPRGPSSIEGGALPRTAPEVKLRAELVVVPAAGVTVPIVTTEVSNG